MKKLLILIAFGAVYLHYFPQPELEEWYTDQKDFVVNAVSEATNTTISLSLNKVVDELDSVTSQFDEEEMSYIKEVTSDKESVKNFYEENCKNSSHNDKLVQEHVSKVCGTLNQFSLFL